MGRESPGTSSNDSLGILVMSHSTSDSSSSSLDSSDSDTKHIRKAYRKMKRLQSNPIKSAIKTEKKINMFIGSIDESNTAQDLINHMSSFDIIIDPTEISEIPQKSDNKAFKVV